MIADPFLNYFALGILFFVVVVLFYGIIAIHDIPHLIAKSRNHPHQDAIHAAGWVSLFTLHALWPFLWIWAMAYRPERGWGISRKGEAVATEPVISPAELENLRTRLTALEVMLAARRAYTLGIGVLSGGYGTGELERAGAYRVYDDPADLLDHLDEIGVR